MNENKILAAILTIAVSARASRAGSAEVGKENWRGVIKDYGRILAELDPKSAKKGG
ncbi:MAG: hypothetical protein WA211_13685 [Candidatus Acidiferrales bacterium]